MTLKTLVQDWIAVIDFGKAAAYFVLIYILFQSAMLLGFALAMGGFQPLNFTAVAVASVLFQGVIVSGFSYFAWFWLMRRYLAAQLAVLSFMTPLFGVLFGVLILDEPLTPGFLIGSLLVLAGISLVSGADWLRRRWRALSV